MNRHFQGAAITESSPTQPLVPTSNAVTHYRTTSNQIEKKKKSNANSRPTGKERNALSDWIYLAGAGHGDDASARLLMRRRRREGDPRIDVLSEGLGGGGGEGVVELGGAAEAGELGGEGSGDHRHGRSERVARFKLPGWCWIKPLAFCVWWL